MKDSSRTLGAGVFYAGRLARITSSDFEARVEAGSNTSTVALRVVGGDEKGSLQSVTVKYGHESHGTRTRKWLHWRGAAAIVNNRSVLSSERAPHINKPASLTNKNLGGISRWVLYFKREWPTDRLTVDSNIRLRLRVEIQIQNSREQTLFKIHSTDIVQGSSIAKCYQVTTKQADIEEFVFVL
jgi:hypothetical protein